MRCCGTLGSNSRRGGLPVREEAPQQNYLADADHQQNEGLSNGPESHSCVEVLGTAASLTLPQTEMCLIVNDRFQGLMNGHAGRLHLGQSSDPVLIGEKWRILSNLKIEVDGLVREGGKLIAEAELVCSILGSREGKAVILLLHFFVKNSTICILQTTVNIVMPTSDNLELKCTLGANGNIFIETLFCVIWKLKRKLGAKRPSTEQVGPKNLHQHSDGTMIAVHLRWWKSGNLILL